MKKKKSKSKSFCVYLGPTILTLINRGTIYPGTKEEVLKRLSRELSIQPLIADLIVDGDMLPEALEKVRTPGNLLYENYRKIAKK